MKEAHLFAEVLLCEHSGQNSVHLDLLITHFITTRLWCNSCQVLDQLSKLCKAVL